MIDGSFLMGNRVARALIWGIDRRIGWMLGHATYWIKGGRESYSSGVTMSVREDERAPRLRRRD